MECDSRLSPTKKFSIHVGFANVFLLSPMTQQFFKKNSTEPKNSHLIILFFKILTLKNILLLTQRFQDKNFNASMHLIAAAAFKFQLSA